MMVAEARRVSEFAPAKVNLALHVTGQRADGYHLLDSLVMFANIGDQITAERAGSSTLDVTGPLARGVPTDARNSMLRAAEWAGVAMRMSLDKHLPHEAGIGGGSSDAAAALRAAEALSGAPLSGAMEEVGADVPVCYLAKACVMRGIGEDVRALTGFPRLAAVLANPGVPVATPAVFAKLTNKQNPALPSVPRLHCAEDVAAFLSAQTRNDLEPPALAIEPVIGDVLDRLWAAEGALFARMSGSGATCFALFSEIQGAEQAAQALRAQNPAWWVSAVWLN